MGRKLALCFPSKIISFTFKWSFSSNEIFTSCSLMTESNNNEIMRCDSCNEQRLVGREISLSKYIHYYYRRNEFKFNKNVLLLDDLHNSGYIYPPPFPLNWNFKFEGKSKETLLVSLITHMKYLDSNWDIPTK